MGIRHKKVPNNILQGESVLDLGCGRKKLTGAIGLDMRDHENVDIVSDLEKPLPFADATFDVVHADQVMEHIHKLIELVYEVYRVLKPGGTFVFHVPYYKSSWAHIDPTHVRSFTIQTMNYFVKGNYINDDYSFREEAFDSCEIYLDTDYKSTFFRGIFSNLALRYPEKFENSILSYIYQFEQLSYVMRK